MPIQKQQTREQLIEDIYFLLKHLEEDKAHLAKPYADIFSFTALPVLLYFTINKSGFVNYLANYYQSYYEEKIAATLDSERGYSLLKKVHNEAVITIGKFQQQLIEMSKDLLKLDPKLQAHLGIENIDNETTWPFPTSLAQLPMQGEHHLLFKIARYIDMLLEQQFNVKHLKTGFVQALNAVIQCGFRLSEIPTEEMLVQAPELQGKIFKMNTFDPQSEQISVTRATNILRLMYPDCANFDKLHQEYFSKQAANLARQHLAYLEYFIALVVAMLAKGFFVNPLAKKLLPLNRYLREPVNFKINYNILDLQGLQREKNALEVARRKLAPYVARHQKISNLISLLVITYGLYLFIEGLTKGGFFLLKLAYTPLFIGAIGEKLINWMAERNDYRNVKLKIARLENDCKFVLGDAAKHFKFTPNAYDKLSLSTLQVTAIKVKESILSHFQYAELLTMTLNHFGVQLLPSYTATEFSLDAQTILRQKSRMKFFWNLLLKSAIDIKYLNAQIKELAKLLGCEREIEKNIELQQQGILTCQYRIPLLAKISAAQEMLVANGFKLAEDILILDKNSPFGDTQFPAMLTEIRKLLKQEEKAEIGLPGEISSQQPKQRKGKKTEILAEELLPPPTPITKPLKIIKWPCGAIYPGDAEPIAGAKNQYRLWKLRPEDLGQYEKFHNTFKDAALHKAKGELGKSGIKARPAIGTDPKTGKQRLFPAHVKIPGTTLGNTGITLDKEKAKDGEELYIAVGFESNIHQKIK